MKYRHTMAGTARVLLAAALAAAAALPAAAQDDDSRIAGLEKEISQLKSDQKLRDKKDMLKNVFGSGKYTTLSYVDNTLKFPEGSKVGGKFGVGLTKGKTYFLTRPIADVLRIGLDVDWSSITYTQYKGKDIELGKDGDWDDDGDDYDYGNDDGDEPSSQKMHQIDLGALGVGPSVTVAPFTHCSSKGLRHLKAHTYFQYLPTYSLLLTTGDGTEVNHGYVNTLKWGLSLQWKAISLGVELRWRSGKYNNESLDMFQKYMPDEDDDYGYGNYGYDDGDGDSSDKIKLKNTETRFTLGFSF